VLIFIKSSTINMLVELNIFENIPFLLHVLEISPKLFPAGISFFKGEIFPELLVEELVDGSIGVDAGTGIAVPVPDTTGCRPLLEDLNR
jgi:hypothetical protein